MLLWPRENGLTFLFKKARVFKVWGSAEVQRKSLALVRKRFATGVQNRACTDAKHFLSFWTGAPTEFQPFLISTWGQLSGARLRGRTATQRSEKGSEKVLGGVLGKGSQKGSEKGACYGFYSKKGF